MIKAILIFNNHGKPRLSKFYQPYYGEETQGLMYARGWFSEPAASLATPFAYDDFTELPGLYISPECFIYKAQILLLEFGVYERSSTLGNKPKALCMLGKCFPANVLIGGSDNKLIYRHYATLYFVFCVDSSESELGILDLIQVFVETLDKCFENVCELDLIFHVDKVHNILAEMVMGGMVLETNMNEIVTQIDAQSKLEKSESLEESQQY
ncbi:hypothetical protein STEG23_028884 [Scotinomys teguina]